jgi:hypothetical protein
MKSGQSWISYLFRNIVVALNFACAILIIFMRSSHVERNFEFLSFFSLPLLGLLGRTILFSTTLFFILKHGDVIYMSHRA